LISCYAFFKNSKSLLLQWIGALFFGLSLLTKETAIVLPAILFFSFIYIESLGQNGTPFERLKKNLNPACKSILPFMGVTLIYFWIRFRVLNGLGGYAEKPALLKRIVETSLGHPLGLLFGGFSPYWAMGIFIPSVFFLMAILIFLVFRFSDPSSSTFQKSIELLSSRAPFFLPFAFWFFLFHFSLFIFFGFNFRYLYIEVAVVAIFLALCLLYMHTLSKGSGNFRLQRMAIVGLFFLVLGNLVLGSSLFSSRHLNRWNEDGLLAENLMAQVLETSRKSGKDFQPQTYFLVNFPYQKMNHPKINFFSFPFSIITLEHSVQAYLDLHSLPNAIKVVGLSYLYFYPNDQNPPIQLAISFERPNQIHTEVIQGGAVTGNPWKESYGPQHRDLLYTVKKPGKNRKDEILIELTPKGLEQPNARYFVYDGSSNLIILENPFQ
jgi:hypothetical protein